MFARMDARSNKQWAVALSAAAFLGLVAPARAQVRPQAGRPAAPQAQAKAPTAPGEAPKAKVVAIPVNPGDAVALVNGEKITRQQLADEAVARKGSEILETMIARRLIEQAVRAAKLEITAGEINDEIDQVGLRVAGLQREAWLRVLDKERGISPEQYARDIIYPALALRKLAAPRVQVTEDDLKKAFEAAYGAKVRCRIIMTDKLRTAQEIWGELKKNPNAFEKIARERSTDTASGSLGGLLGEPIARHAYPLNVSEAAFSQLVDGDLNEKDPEKKPKDGDFTGPIQVTDTSWVIIRREGLIPAQDQSLENAAVRRNLHDMVYEVKLKEEMGTIYEKMMQTAAIENRLTGQVKLANEEQQDDFRAATADGNVRLMSNPAAGAPQTAPAPAAGQAPGAKLPTPSGVSAEELQRVESLKKTSPPRK